MGLAFQMRRLVRHSAVYGIGGLVSRILATILLPLYTHYLPPGSFGRVEIITAATAVLAIVLQMGISSAFFRSVKSLVIFEKPLRFPASSRKAVKMTLAQNREPSLRTRQPSSSNRPSAACCNSSAGQPCSTASGG